MAPDNGQSKFKPLMPALGSDFTAGMIAGGCVAPFIAAVDRGLAENASGKCKLFPSIRNTFVEMAKQPGTFFKGPQFMWIWLVYGGTYFTANMTDTFCFRKDVDVSLPKLASTFCVNTATCIAKDRAFAKMYGVKEAAAVPMGSYAVWLFRDILSMGVFFTLPPIVGKEVAKFSGSERSGYMMAQFGLPLVCQTFLTPIHLLGYDIYNNPNNNVGQRIQFLKKDYFKNVASRCLRQAPPWSVGTIGNKELREYFRGKI